MAFKISLKRAVFILSSLLITMILSACMDPVDVQTFMKDPEVVKIIDSTKKPPSLVKIDPGSENFENLRAGESSISGLTSGKYYMLEEYDDSNEKVYTRTIYIKSDGTNSGSLSGIGLLIGTQLTNLKSNYTYKITSAKPFDTEGTYEYFFFGSGNNAIEADVSNANGVTTVSAVISGTGNYYLDLSDEIAADGNYEIMVVPSTTAWGTLSRTSAYYSGSGNISLDSSYIKYGLQNFIGVYQYRTDVSSGNISLRDKSLIVLPGASITPSDYLFVKYDGNNNVTNLSFIRVDVKQTVTESDFTIDNLTQDYGSVTDVSIKPQDGKTTGYITIYYEGTGSTTYEKSDTLPTDVGSYTVTFDVEAADIYAAARELSAGTLTINKATPTADDYDIGNLTQAVGNVTAVSITPKEGKSNGARTIYYEGTGGTTYSKSTTLPSAVGTYTVTFDVALDANNSNWNTATGLSAGILTIHKPSNVTISVSFTGFSSEYTPYITLSKSSFNQSETSFETTLTLNNHGEYNVNDIKWYDGDNNSATSIGSGVSLKLDFTKSNNIDWWQEGEHHIYLVLTDTNNVLPPQSGVVIIKCQQ